MRWNALECYVRLDPVLVQPDPCKLCLAGSESAATTRVTRTPCMKKFLQSKPLNGGVYEMNIANRLSLSLCPVHS